MEHSTLKPEPADLDNTPTGPYIVREQLGPDGEPLLHGLFVSDGVGIGSGPLAVIVRRGAPWPGPIGLKADADLAALFAAAPALLVLVKQHRVDCEARIDFLEEKLRDGYGTGGEEDAKEVQNQIDYWQVTIDQIDEVLNNEYS